MELCSCPNPAAIATITDYDCPEDFKEIVKLFFSRKREFQGVTDPSTVVLFGTLAEWATTLAAVDDTKTVVSPLLDDIENEPGAPIVEEMTVRNVVTGLEPTVFTGFMDGAPQTTVALFKALTCEKVLYVYFADRTGALISGLDGTEVVGFKLSNNSFAMQDLEMKKRLRNKNRFTFQLEPGWSDTAVKTIPSDFDALTDLTN